MMFEERLLELSGALRIEMRFNRQGQLPLFLSSPYTLRATAHAINKAFTCVV
jgi:hypothetical protein